MQGFHTANSVVFAVIVNVLPGAYVVPVPVDQPAKVQPAGAVNPAPGSTVTVALAL